MEMWVNKNGSLVTVQFFQKCLRYFLAYIPKNKMQLSFNYRHVLSFLPTLTAADRSKTKQRSDERSQMFVFVVYNYTHPLMAGRLL
jgi:hypothetical protein